MAESVELKLGKIDDALDESIGELFAEIIIKPKESED